jgi:hypothetical protein
VIENAVALSVCRQFGVDARAAEKIERRFRFGEEFVPQVKGEIFINTAKSRNEMVFERAYSTFSGVAAMQSGRNELVVNVFGDEVGLEHRQQTLVVQTLELWAQTGGDKSSVEDCERMQAPVQLFMGSTMILLLW